MGHSTCLLLDVLMDEPSWFPPAPLRNRLVGEARELCDNCGGILTGSCGVFFCGRQAGGRFTVGASNRGERHPGGSGR